MDSGSQASEWPEPLKFLFFCFREKKRSIIVWPIGERLGHFVCSPSYSKSLWGDQSNVRLRGVLRVQASRFGARACN